MNRYDIRNKKTGKTFSYKANDRLPHQPEWGVDPEIIVTNIDAEIAAESAKKKEQEERAERLKNYKPADVSGLPEIKEMLKDLIDFVKEKP